MQWLKAAVQALLGMAHRHLVYQNRWSLLPKLQLPGWLFTSSHTFVELRETMTEQEVEIVLQRADDGCVCDVRY